MGTQHEKHRRIATDTICPLPSGDQSPADGFKAVETMSATIRSGLATGGVCLQAASTCAYVLHTCVAIHPMAGYKQVDAPCLLEAAVHVLDIIWRMPGVLSGLKGSSTTTAQALAAAGDVSQPGAAASAGATTVESAAVASAAYPVAMDLGQELVVMAFLVGHSGASERHLAVRRALHRLRSSTRADLMEVGCWCWAWSHCC
jgi:hypothetical protein